MAIALIIPHPKPRMTLREMKLAAECLRLKASLFNSGITITALEERNRALAARNAQLTQALHRAHS
jgi:hypothetical protein